MDADLDTLATALYVTTDDFLTDNPQHRPWRPKIGLAPRLSDAELVTLVVLQALLGYTSEGRFLRYAKTHLRPMFPYLPTQSGYNKRVRAATHMLRAVIAHLVKCTSCATDDVWVVDSTPVECGRSRETAKRSDLAGWAEYGYCASHSRYFWGLRLHLLCTLSGLPVAFALTGAKADEREILLGMLDADPTLVATHPAPDVDGGQELLRQGVRGRHSPTPRSSCCARPARARNPVRDNASSSRYGRSSNRSTTPSKRQLDLERHGGRTIAGVAARVLQRILALTAAIWHNDHTGQSTLRSLTAYDH